MAVLTTARDARPGSSAVRRGGRQAGDPAGRSLSDLRPGDSGRVSGFRDGLSPVVARRLRDLGVEEGVEVSVLRRAPLGDPCVYRVRDYDLCLRRREAGAILCTDRASTSPDDAR